MKTISFLTVILMYFTSCSGRITVPEIDTPPVYGKVNLGKIDLHDKIRGGWAGQIIGCTYGGPTEFRYRGMMVPEYVSIPWNDCSIREQLTRFSGLYDDVYMDLTFVGVLERLGIDAPIDSFAVAFASANYPLWHANQAARHNILQGVMPPESGHWRNNPHADDIDFQIEADFAGLMAPGMPNGAAEVSDRIGHIMNYGDGWYGGVYMSAMYALAFVSDDVGVIVTEALKCIPAESRYYKCIADVIAFHKEYPDDWRRAWFECELAWNSDIGCPDGVFDPLNIDATLNSAYVVIGLLYGGGDFLKTMDIAMRCGQDSDCNPASAAGILGTMIGYSRIPDVWKKSVEDVQDIPFAYTNISLNSACRMSMNHALQMIERGGGSITNDSVTIPCQNPEAVRFEESFAGHILDRKLPINGFIETTKGFDFDGVGFVARGYVQGAPAAYTARIAVKIDGQQVETVHMPANEQARRLEIAWKYDLPQGLHRVELEWLNPQKGVRVWMGEAIVYKASNQ